jgi:aerobic carbon-monoxide dehydrogenase large subunit
MATRPQNTFVGSPIERREDWRFLRGQGTYVDDIARDDMLHAAIVRSPMAHGRIRGIDASAALALAGVRSVITAAELPKPIPTITLRAEHTLPSLVPFLQPVIASDEVRYVGEPVAIVLAESAALAEDAADAVVLDIDPLPAVTDREAALKGGALVVAAAGSNEMARLVAIKGDAERAFAAAPYTRRERFRVQRHTAIMMEPRGLLAEWDAARGRLTVCGAAKTAFMNRRMLARHLALAEDAIDMVENDVGGGFGVRGEFYPEDFLVPFAARKMGRPVKWIEDRREHFLASNHARDLQAELEIACAKDGTILGLRGRVLADQGAYIRTNGATAPRNVAQVGAGPYRIANIHIESVMLATNKTPIGTYRGPGRFEGDFFRERLIDMAARDLGLDRVEMRRRNLVPERDMPWPHAEMAPYGGGEYDSGDYLETLERCLKEFDWHAKAARQGRLVDGRYRGLGLGCYIEGGASGPSETARLAMEEGGSIAVYIGSSSVGQGIETIFAQIAADALGLPMSRIGAVRHGSTAYVSEGVGSHASRSTVMGGSAILLAAETFKAALFSEASRRLGAAPDTLELTDGAVAARGGGAVPFADLAGISTEATFKNSRRTYAYGGHAAEVAVDPRTGAIEVLDYVAVEDVGRIINPLTLHGQAVGAIVQGLGGALMEDLVYDERVSFWPPPSPTIFCPRPRTCRISVRSRSNRSPRRPIPWAPRARARAVSCRSAASSPTPSPRPCHRSMSSLARSRFRRRKCGSSSRRRKAARPSRHQEEEEVDMRILILAFALAAMAIDAGHAAPTTLRVGKANPIAATMVPLAVGEKEGLFAKHNLKVELFDFAGGAKLHQAIAAGSLDIGVGAGTDLVLVAKGSPELAICNGAGPLLFIGMAVPEGSKAKTLADLKGARIGVTTVHSLTYWLALELARQHGWGHDGVQPIAIGGGAPAVLAAFRTHLVDAGITSTALIFQMEATGRGRLLAPVSSWAGSLGGSTIFATRALIDKNPDAIRRFLAAWFDAVRFMQTHRDQSIKIAAEMTGMPLPIEAREFDLTLPMFNLNGRFDKEMLANLSRSFVDLKELSAPPDMSKLYTEEFLPK